ncbi:MAG TPA: immunoglobulin domain-containing protein, partial [Candidatus Hydrogenedentes bacterium]|nr:immunoglobulin domain-containing protein [Candidatus Hydrogenedentota bacterium]
MNLKLTFWYRNESGASVIAYVLRDGVWTAAANAGAAAAWTKSETSLTGTITGIFFRLDSGDNKYRRLDCISIVGEPDCTPPVVITQHPTNLSVCPGSPVAFSVSATGSNLTYQWRKNGVDLADGGNVSGATTDTLLIADAQLADNGRYRCVVTGDCGTVLSNLADLTVSEQPTVTQQPQSRNVLAGSAATFTVAASGAGTLSYQWQKDGADLNDGGNVSGAHAAQLQISNVGEDDQANYRCAVTDDCGTVISKPALLTMRYEVVLFEETFSTDPFSGGRWRIEKDGVARPGTVNYYTSGGQCGSPAGYIERHYDGHRDVIYNGSFTTAGHGNLKLIFWYHNDSSAAITAYVLQNGSWVSVANVGAAGAWTRSESNLTGTITGIFFKLDGGNDKYRRLDCISIVSEPVCEPPVVITQHPRHTAVCPGGTALLDVAASGSSLTYQWQKDGADLSDGGDISGAATPILQIANADPDDNGDYMCVVRGDCGTKFSNPAMLVVSSNPIILKHPQSQEAPLGGAATFSVTVLGAGTVTYQWQRDGNDLGDGGGVSGTAT